MGGHIRVLFLVAVTLAVSVSVSGCALPGGSTKILAPVSPTPTAVPNDTATPAPSPTAVPSSAPTTPASAPAVDAGANISRTYGWEYGNINWAFTAVVPKVKYDLIKAKPHSTDINFASYAMASEGQDLLQSAAAQLVQGGAGRGFTRPDDARNAIAFVQSIPYVDDHPSGNPRYPLETLADGQGDCKDKAVLAAALLRAMGFDAVLLQFPGHVALGLNVDASAVGVNAASYPYGGARYFYVEVSSVGWQIGDVPAELRGTGPVILPLVKYPALEITVAASPVDAMGGLVDYRVSYSVTNTGPGTAKHLVLKVRAMAPGEGENVIWDREHAVELGDLAEGQTIRSDELVVVPSGKPSRVVCIVSGENADPTQASTADFVA